MSVLSGADLVVLTDHIGGAWRLYKAGAGTRSGSAVAGTARHMAEALFTFVVTDLDDYEQHADLEPAANKANTTAAVESVGASWTNGLINALDNHVRDRGGALDSSINSVPSYLAFLNSVADGTPFSVLLSPEFAEAWKVPKKTDLEHTGVYSPYIGPANGQANGLGTRTVGGAYTAGASVDVTKYAEVLGVAVVTTNFADGTAPPTVTVTGIDNTGATMTWTATGGSNNPAAAVATTLGANVTSYGRVTIALASAAGVVKGSRLGVGVGTAQEEYVLVEAVASNDVTAVFTKTHTSGDAVTGNTTLVLTPATGGRRIRSVSNVAVGVTGHTAGVVRIDGVQERVAV